MAITNHCFQPCLIKIFMEPINQILTNHQAITIFMVCPTMEAINKIHTSLLGIKIWTTYMLGLFMVVINNYLTKYCLNIKLLTVNIHMRNQLKCQLLDFMPPSMDFPRQPPYKKPSFVPYLSKPQNWTLMMLKSFVGK